MLNKNKIDHKENVSEFQKAKWIHIALPNHIAVKLEIKKINRKKLYYHLNI